MHYIRLHADSAGDSHFSEVPIEATVEWEATSTKLVRVTLGSTSPLHPEPSPTLVTALQGSVTITASDGN